MDQTATDQEAIRRTLAEYCHLLDDADFDGFAGLFADQAEVQIGRRNIRGRASIREWIESSSPPGMRHLAMNHLIKVDGKEASAVSDFVVVTSVAKLSHLGRYEDKLERGVDGTWRFTSHIISTVF